MTTEWPDRSLTLDAATATSIAMAPPDETIADLSFEDALRRLEEIVHRLESGEETLDASISLYSEGDRLRAQCERRLADAQARIEKITLSPDGTATGTVPFDAE